MPLCLETYWLKESKFMAKRIIGRIDGVLKNIDTVQREMKHVSFAEFKAKSLLPDAISFYLAQIGERMNKLEELLKEQYPNLPWKEARKMRNIIVHDYDNANFETIYQTAVYDLPILKNELIKVKDNINQTSKRTFETERLFLRPWNDYDADELFELAKEPEIGYWCGWEPHKHIRDSFFALHNFLEIDETYAICLKESGYIIGSIALHFHSDLIEKENECELGYWIGKPYWNNGYVTEAAKEIIKHAFTNLGISTIWVGRYDGNEKSKRVQEKLGFAFHHSCDDVYVTQLKTTRVGHVSLLTKEEWIKTNKQ